MIGVVAQVDVIPNQIVRKVRCLVAIVAKEYKKEPNALDRVLWRGKKGPAILEHDGAKVEYKC
jgi:hypothetical protein